ncbi:MAG: hypothetical protein JWN79_707 [Gemmatimonadetes bacterium]|jgi:hypothetical protein|nr:hypothetical protein [Gemmatimonadota bacterium]
MNQTQRTLQEYRSALTPAQVLAAAKKFFASRPNIYAVFPDQEGPNHLSFRGQGTEELLIAAIERDGATLVTGSSYLFDMQIARFFTTLAPYALTENLLPPGPAAVQAPDREARA